MLGFGGWDFVGTVNQSEARFTALNRALRPAAAGIWFRVRDLDVGIYPRSSAREATHHNAQAPMGMKTAPMSISAATLSSRQWKISATRT